MNIEIPQELFQANAHNHIIYKPIEGKTVIGLMGYARAGKDTVGHLLLSRMGFKRISFGDIVKQFLNLYMKEKVYEDLKSQGEKIPLEKIDFLNPETNDLKEKLRPYMIWFGETLKQHNGMHQWTNMAFSMVQPEDKKLVITDVRRPNELELFRNGKEFFKRTSNMKKKYNLSEDKYDQPPSNTLLIEINQLYNRDADKLTIETILTAHEEWLIDHTIMVDSRIPETNNSREIHMMEHLYEIVNKYPDYLI